VNCGGKLKKEKPDWLRIKHRQDDDFIKTEEILRKLTLHTVCEEAACPNRCECFGRKTATFMILGNLCTRNCSFCNVEKHKPLSPDKDEPYRVAKAVHELGLRHVVITSVTRDDLLDGGAGHFAETIKAIRSLCPEVTIEALIPDFAGDTGALEKIVSLKPDIINHNVETVPSLYSAVRPMAIYERSLLVLRNVKFLDGGIYTKSGIMLGLGEKEDEVYKVILDIKNAGCDILTIGQYLSPSKKHHPVAQYIHPDMFQKFKRFALNAGFLSVASAPLVRSSYMAEKHIF
jgi:lipoic acid synthetase